MNRRNFLKGALLTSLAVTSAKYAYPDEISTDSFKPFVVNSPGDVIYFNNKKFEQTIVYDRSRRVYIVEILTKVPKASYPNIVSVTFEAPVHLISDSRNEQKLQNEYIKPALFQLERYIDQKLVL